MALIKRKKTTVLAMNIKEYPPGGYNWTLSMSQIGEPCGRKLFYEFHWSSEKMPTDAKSRRRFRIGDLFEQVAVENLKSIGVEVFRRDEDGNKIELTGEPREKQEVIRGITGHEKGKLDGRVLGLVECPDEECLLEIKTMKAADWRAVVKHGVQSKQEKYYGQVQRYLDAIGLKKAYFLAVNKDTCEYYGEFITIDKDLVRQFKRKELMILATDEIPPRAYDSSENFMCTDRCGHYDVCWKGQHIQMNCRTCEHSDLEEGAKWHCNKKDKELDIDAQKAGCKHWSNNWYDDEEI